MPNPYISMTNDDPDLIKIQRQQRLADMLQQQAMQDIPINSSGGIQAPISPFSVLAKALSGYAAKRNQTKADEEMSAYRDKDSAAAQALIRQLTQGANQAGAPDVASVATQLDPTAPQLPGGAAPMAQAPVPMQVGGAQGTPMTQAPVSAQEQMAALLAARGGPQTQMVQNAMLPQLMNRQNLDYQHQLGREDKTWEAAQPLPLARQQEMAGQLQNQEALAEHNNKMNPTPYQQAQLGQSAAELAESRRYHNMGGSKMFPGLSDEDNDLLSEGILAKAIDPTRLNSRTAKIYVDVYRKNRDVNFVNAAGHAAMVRNAPYQRTINVAEALPTVLENVREAGKKLNYSDVAAIGKLQGWARGQVNDPDVVNYMTQRNDALLSVANVMRGVGMSDMATRMEQEASSPSMSPRALDAWVDAQQKSLAPRLAQYRRNALGDINQKPPPPAIVPSNNKPRSVEDILKQHGG